MKTSAHDYASLADAERAADAPPSAPMQPAPPAQALLRLPACLARLSPRCRWALAALGAAALALAVAAAVVFSQRRPPAPMAATLSAALSPQQPPQQLRNGVNRAPLCDSGASVGALLPGLGVRLVRTHDARALDWWVIFPDPTRDPEVAANYDFSAGDALFAAILAAGQEPYLRLGVSWPPGSPPVLPPVPQWSLAPDAALFARVSVHTLAHYNDAAWAGGFTGKRIKYAEIWNEPDGKSPLMWAGSVQQFYALFDATARAIKLYDPGVKVGGPGVARVADPDFGAGLVEFLVKAGTPFDFFSFHYYGSAASRPLSVGSTAAAVSAHLNDAGLASVELHVTEWNTDALPRNTQRDSALAAAFVASALTEFVQSNVTLAALYPACAGLGPSSWGIFEDVGDGSGAILWRRETHAYAALGQALLEAPRALAGASVPPNTDSTIFAGASAQAPPLPGAGAALAYNVTAVVSTQSPRFNGLALRVTDLPPAARVRLVAELVDEVHSSLDVVLDAAETADAAGALTVSVGFTSPAVVRVRISPRG